MFLLLLNKRQDGKISVTVHSHLFILTMKVNGD